jgi:hypothetical protein
LVMENNQILTFKVSYFLSFYFFVDFRKWLQWLNIVYEWKKVTKRIKNI